MGVYLTNISRDRAGIVRLAAKLSGMAVEYRDHPMPKNHVDPDNEYYFPENLGYLGSIYTNEPRWDHSKFWRAYERIQEQQKTLDIMAG